jgi:hypothetical protein
MMGSIGGSFVTHDKAAKMTAKEGKLTPNTLNNVVSPKKNI